MDFLNLIYQTRTPFFTGLFSALTYLGDELVFMVTVLVVLWCVDKKWGYRLFAVGMMGTTLNQILKAVFLVPRPWVLNSSFEPVESALESAGGYSFPSGHTQSAATLFGGIAVWIKRKWVTVVSILLVLITAYSRMYLGVHTPLDVGVSLATGLLTVLGFMYLFKKADHNPRVSKGIGIALFIGALILLLYVMLWPKTERNVAQFDEEGLKNAYTVLGTVLGLIVSRFVDSRYIRYETRAAWWAQVLKLAIGVGFVVIVRVTLKAPLLKLFHGHGAADSLRYFLMTVTAGVLWPLTFRFWAKSQKT